MTAMAIDFTLSPELEDIRLRVRTFVDEVVKPGEAKIGDSRARWIARSTSSLLLGMREAAKDAGLWLPHMPKEWGGMGLGHVELAMVQAEAAKASYGPFVLNCQAPDEGNMHTLLHWATPRAEGEVPPPAVRRHEDELLRDDRARGRRLRPDAHPDHAPSRTATSGSSTATSGSSPTPGGPRSRSCSPGPRTTPTCRRRPTRRSSSTSRRRAGTGCARSRPCTAAAGTARSSSRTCACPTRTCSAAAGRATCSASTGSGPARLAHCMRWIAQAETALDMMVDRSLNRYAHGSVLAEKQGIQWMIADSTMELYQCQVDGAARRLPIDHGLDFKTEVSMAKHFVANMLGRVIDRSIQVHGALGYSTDTPLASMYPARPLGAVRRRRRRGPPDAHRPAHHRRLPRPRLDAHRHRRPAGVASGTCQSAGIFEKSKNGSSSWAATASSI